MVRAKKGAASRQAKRRLFKLVKGYRGGRKSLLRTAKTAILRSRKFAYRDRRVRRRTFRSLWILRINAACRQRGTRYGVFMHGLSVAGVEINRKMLAHLAIVNPTAFDHLIRIAQGELAAA